MATLNPFELLGTDENDDPEVLAAKPAAAKPAAAAKAPEAKPAAKGAF